MNIFELICPNCGKILHKVAYDLLCCRFCQSEFIIEEENEESYLIHEFKPEPLKEYIPLPPPPRKIVSVLLLVFVIAILTIALLIYLIIAKEPHTSAREKINVTVRFSHMH